MPTLRDTAAAALRDHVAPSLELNPADLELVGVEDGIASVRLSGACAGCGVPVYSIIMQVEAELRRHVPGVKLVEAVA